MNTINTNSSILLPVGITLNGKYTVTKQLLSKQFGNLYVANNTKLKENVLIKELYVINISKRSSDNKSIDIEDCYAEIYEEYKEKFNDEAICLRQVNNPHVIKIIDLFSENNTCYCVMEFTEGELLSQKMTRKNDVLGETEALSYLTQMIEGLNSMHNSGIWHLDINPSNILLDNNGQIKFIDFGHCKLVDNEATVVASSNHDPLELQSLDINNIGPWTDFYQLGSTLYNLMTGKIPPSSRDVNEATTSLYKFPSNVSKKTQRLILWMMTPNIFRRPQDIGEIKDFLYGIQSISQIGQNENANSSPNTDSYLKKSNKNQNNDDEDNDGLSNKTLKAMQIFIFLSVILFLGFLAYKFLYDKDDDKDKEKNVVNLVKEKTTEGVEETSYSLSATDSLELALKADSINKKNENTASEKIIQEKKKDEDMLNDTKGEQGENSEINNTDVLHQNTSINVVESSVTESTPETNNKTSEKELLQKNDENNNVLPDKAITKEIKAVEQAPQKFNIVVGSFESKDNADARANELRAKGFSVSVKHLESNKMFRVVVQGVDEYSKNKIKETYSDAWTE